MEWLAFQSEIPGKTTAAPRLAVPIGKAAGVPCARQLILEILETAHLGSIVNQDSPWFFVRQCSEDFLGDISFKAEDLIPRVFGDCLPFQPTTHLDRNRTQKDGARVCAGNLKQSRTVGIWYVRFADELQSEEIGW